MVLRATSFPQRYNARTEREANIVCSAEHERLAPWSSAEHAEAKNPLFKLRRTHCAAPALLPDVELRLQRDAFLPAGRDTAAEGSALLNRVPPVRVARGSVEELSSFLFDKLRHQR